MSFTLSTLGIEEIGSASSIKSIMLADDNSDWLHRIDTYMRGMKTLEELQNVPISLGLHDQDSFTRKSAYEEKKKLRDSSEQTRQRKRERYSLMTDEQRDVRLQKNREYKKCMRENKIMGDNNNIITASASTPIVQAQPYKYHHTGLLAPYILYINDVLLAKIFTYYLYV